MSIRRKAVKRDRRGVLQPVLEGNFVAADWAT